MKVIIEEIPGAETELVLRCQDSSSPEAQRIAKLLDGLTERIPVHQALSTMLLSPGEILYFEYVNRKTFAYTESDVYPCELSLTQLENEYPDYFRCSKSAVLNISQIRHLRSELNGRILVELSNGEKLLVSRYYASELRRHLK